LNDQYIGREFHRKSALDANKDQKNASRLLKEATKGETLQEWFDKEKQKPAPKAQDASSEKKYEAYGVKGMNSTQWRKEFKSYEEAEKWADKNNAEIQGFREKE
jgi:hypothetical protein